MENQGQLVTREQIIERLWGDNVFVDTRQGINTAAGKLRVALQDDPGRPRLLQTVVGRGYRLLAPVSSLGAVDGGVLPQKTPVPAPRKAPTPLQSLQSYGWHLLLGVIAALGALAGLWIVLRPPEEPKILRITRLTNDFQAKSGPMATDGFRIYFNETLQDGRRTIAQVPVTGGEVVPLSTPIVQPFVQDLSLDGTELLVSNVLGIGSLGVHRLWLQPVAGGSPRRVGSVQAAMAGFGRDGNSILYSTEHDVESVNLDGTSPRRILAAENTYAFRPSPDGRAFRFTQATWDSDTTRIVEVNQDGTGLRPMFEGCCQRWTTDGRYFIFQTFGPDRENLWSIREAPASHWWAKASKPTQLTAGPLDFQTPLPSRDGKQIFAIGTSRQAEVTRYDVRSHQFVPYLSGISAEGLGFSPDGQWVAYTSYPDGSLWKSRVAGTERLQLTFSPMKVVMPRWSPDGKQIAFNALLPGASWNIYVISSAGGTSRRVLPSDQSQLDVDWSPDGNSLVFGSAEEPKRSIYILDLKSMHVSMVPGSIGFFSPHWSPDGKYIAALTNRTEKLMLLDSATQLWTEVSAPAAGYPMWSHDGKCLYFLFHPAEGISYRIVRLRLSNRKIEDVADVAKSGRLTAGTFGRWFGLAPDESPVVARDISTQEVYALDMSWP